MREYAGIKVLYCTNDEMAAGAYQACVDKGREDIDIIGYDGSPDCLGLIKDGKVTGTLAQSPFDMGYEAVKILYDTVKNGKFAGESTTLIKTQVIDKSNAVEYLDSLRTKITNAIGKCWF